MALTPDDIAVFREQLQRSEGLLERALWAQRMADDTVRQAEQAVRSLKTLLRTAGEDV